MKLNKELELPECYQLRYVLKEYKTYIDKLLAEIDELKDNNKVLIEKGKSLEKEKNELQKLDKTELRQITKEIKQEELYKNIKKENKKLREQIRSLRKDNAELVYKLQNRNNSKNGVHFFKLF